MSRTAVNLGLAGCLLFGLVDLGLLTLWAAPRAFPSPSASATTSPDAAPRAATSSDVGSALTARPDAAPRAAARPDAAPRAATRPDAAPRAATRPDAAPLAATRPDAAPPRTTVVYFDTGAKLVRPHEARRLQKLAALLLRHPGPIQIDGHTDQRGDQGLNEKLSQERAEAVRAVLQAAGVGGERLRVRGFGLAKPASTANTPGGWQANRRVEIRVD
jgi:outer membrane protein OmpA-like peptidoglycan-associated protein